MPHYYKIAVNTPFNKGVLTYSADQELTLGSLVILPLGKREEKGCVLQKIERPSDESLKIKSIKEITQEDFILSSEDLEFFNWLSRYYHYSLGQLIFDILPRMLKRPKKLKFFQGKGEPFPFTLTSDQQDILNKLQREKWEQSLIHGITGSGKTLIYLKYMLTIFEKNKSVLFLLPEINLTPQFTEIFEKYLPVPIYTYHSELSQSDRYGLWKLLQEDTHPKLILGVRSSVFLPIKNLGLIIVDEEHDGSFKQEDRFTYHARDVALKKGSLYNVPVVLGSATPSLETYHRFFSTPNYHIMNKRVGEANLPEIELVDILEHQQVKGMNPFWPLHEKSLQEIDAALKKGEQVLVFLNRLGFAHHVQCRSCGRHFDCANCTTHLRYYKDKQKLFCQYCEYEISVPTSCPDCHSLSLIQKGFGTEKIHEVLSLCFKSHKISRFDRDEIKNFSDLKQRLKDFHDHKIDILVGTQMLSKGHNFERVNLVLILGIDAQLNSSDFRAEEKIFQLITQVAGRSGRFGKKSKVLIQTLNAQSSLFSHITKGELKEFYQKELLQRKEIEAPPFYRLIALYFHSPIVKKVIETSQAATHLLQDIVQKHFPHVKVMGPRPSLVEKRAGMYSWCLLLKSSSPQDLHKVLEVWEEHFEIPSGVRLKIDVDPLSFT